MVLEAVEIAEVKEVNVKELSPTEEVAPLGLLEVEEYDPLHVIIRWRNNKLPEHERVHIITLFMFYHERERKWYWLVYRVGREDYMWGSIKENEPVPKRGHTKHSSTWSYAYPVCKATGLGRVRCGVGVFITRPTSVRKHWINYGRGRRILGLHKGDLNKVKVIAKRYFANLFVVKRYVPPATIESAQVKKE